MKIPRFGQDPHLARMTGCAGIRPLIGEILEVAAEGTQRVFREAVQFLRAIEYPLSHQMHDAFTLLDLSFHQEQPCAHDFAPELFYQLRPHDTLVIPVSSLSVMNTTP